MATDDRESGISPERKITAQPTGTPEARPNPLIIPNASGPQVEPEQLVEALRYLQQYIPEFTQLSVREERSMARAGHLDPEFIDTGIQAGSAWLQAKQVIGRTGAELRQEADEIRRWNDVERELRALTKGVAGANLKRKHRLGEAILTIYAILGAKMRLETAAGDSHLRPYYDDMKRAYLRALRKSRKKARSEEPEAKVDGTSGEPGGR